MFFFGRRLQKATVSAVCVGTIVLAFLMACGAVWQYSAWSSTPENFHQPYQTIKYTWLGTDTGHLNYILQNGKSAAFQADAGFLLDPLSSIWLLFVTGVGMLIHIYSTGYMAHEGGYYRFFGYLNLFMFSMLTLILANNYVLMFVGWEGVGLCWSVLLVGGMMAFLSKPDFIDSRFDIFEHQGVLADYLKTMYVISPLEVFDKYHIDHVLVTNWMPVAYLLKRTAGWTIVKRERTGAILVTFAEKNYWDFWINNSRRHSAIHQITHMLLCIQIQNDRDSRECRPEPIFS